MRIGLVSTAGGLALALATAGATGPFASDIRVSVSQIQVPVETAEISYRLPFAATAVTVHAVPLGTSIPAASFAGTADAGLNTVVWDGSVDNAGGAAVPSGPHTLQVQVDWASSEAWPLVRSNTNDFGGGDLMTLPVPFSVNAVVAQTDPAREDFGRLYVGQGELDPDGEHGVFQFEPDLDTRLGGALILDDLEWVGAGDPEFTPWGLDLAEDGSLWAAGQGGDGGVELARGQVDGTGDTDVGGAEPLLVQPRDVLVSGDGAGRVVRWVQGNGADGLVVRAAIGEASALAGGGPVVTEIDASVGAGYSPRSLAMDDGGNLYLLASVSNLVGFTFVYRFDAATLAAGPLPLDTDDASWTVQITGSNRLFASGLCIDHGDRTDPADDIVYALVPQNNAFGSEAGIYRVGVSGTASLDTVLAPETDRVVDLSDPDEILSQNRTDLACDFGGNIVLVDPQFEFLRLYAAPGPSQITTPGAPGQVLQVNTDPPPPGPHGVSLH